MSVTKKEKKVLQVNKVDCTGIDSWEDTCVSEEVIEECGEKIGEVWQKDATLGFECEGLTKKYYERLYYIYSEGCKEATTSTRVAYEKYSTDCGADVEYKWKDGYKCVDGILWRVSYQYMVINDTMEIFTGEIKYLYVIETSQNNCELINSEWIEEDSYCVGIDFHINQRKYNIFGDGHKEPTDEVKTIVEEDSDTCGGKYKYIWKDEEYECLGFDKWVVKYQYRVLNNIEKKTGLIRQELVERNSKDCISEESEWIVIGDICDGNNLYEEEGLFNVYPNGTKQFLNQTRKGKLLVTNSSECDGEHIYIWKEEYICEYGDKYFLRKKYLQLPDGSLQETGKFFKILIEFNSKYCQVISEDWVFEDGECDGTNFVINRRKYLVYADGHKEATDFVNTYIEENSSECGGIYNYFWEDETICIGYDKWLVRKRYKQRKPTTVNWSKEYTGIMEFVEIIEENSRECQIIAEDWFFDDDGYCGTDSRGNYTGYYIITTRKYIIYADGTIEPTDEVSFHSEANSSECGGIYDYYWKEEILCIGYDKWLVRKRYRKSADSEEEYTGYTEHLDLLEKNSKECSPIGEEWIEESSYCDGQDHVIFQRKYLVYPDGHKESTFYTRNLVEENSSECNGEYDYFWKEDILCIDSNKWLVRYRYRGDKDGNEEYTGSMEYIELLDENSNDCITVDIIWEVDGTICEGESLYVKEVEYNVYADGHKELTGNVRLGKLLFEKSKECGAEEDIPTGDLKWEFIENICEDGNLFSKEQAYYLSNDEKIFINKFRITLLEENSDDCVIVDTIWEVDGTICEGESLYVKEVEYNVYANGFKEPTGQERRGDMLLLKAKVCGAEEDVEPDVDSNWVITGTICLYGNLYYIYTYFDENGVITGYKTNVLKEANSYSCKECGSGEVLITTYGPRTVDGKVYGNRCRFRYRQKNDPNEMRIFTYYFDYDVKTCLPKIANTGAFSDYEELSTNSSTIVGGFAKTVPYFRSDPSWESLGGCFGMFYECKYINTENISFDNVRSIKEMFYNCNELTSIELNGPNYEIPIEDATMLFLDCYKLVDVKIRSFKTPNLKNTTRMFGWCENLITIDLSEIDLSNLETANGMFENCYKLKNINFGNWKNNNQTNFARMFVGSGIENTEFFKTCNLKVIGPCGEMFRECTELVHANISYLDWSECAYIEGLFYGCSSLETIDMTNVDLSNTTNYLVNNFGSCGSLKTIIARGCNEKTISVIEYNLSRAGIDKRVTIVTD